MLSKHCLLFSLSKRLFYRQIKYPLNNYNVTQIYFTNTCFSRLGFECQNKWMSSESDKSKFVARDLSTEIKTILNKKKEKLREQETKLKKKGNLLLLDIKETKDKVREKVEEIVERENVYTIPNFLCMTRMVLSPYLGYLIVYSQFDSALIVLAVAAVTDLLDGWIARTWKGQSSKIGSFLDPVADKILIGTLFLTLTYADLIPLVLTAMIIVRDAILVASGFIIRFLSLPPPRTLTKYFDITYATVELAPTFISKLNTAVQLLLVGSTLGAPVFNYVGHPGLECLWYVTGGTTVASALSYVLSKNTYKVLGKSKKCNNNKR